MFARDLASDFDSPFDTLFDDNGLLDFSVPAWHTYRKSGLSFFLTGLPEEEEALGSYFSLCRPSHGDLVFDIGANCGVTTHVLSLLVGAAGRVIAFEPDPDSFHALLANIDRHSLRNVVPIHKAIAAASGIERFNAEGSLGSGLSAFVPRPSAGRVLSVQCSSLADAFAQYGEPTFVKMDVEGAEIAILNAARDLLRGTHSAYALDTGHMVGNDNTVKRVEALFRDCGYETETVKAGLCVTTSARRGG